MVRPNEVLSEQGCFAMHQRTLLLERFRSFREDRFLWELSHALLLPFRNNIPLGVRYLYFVLGVRRCSIYSPDSSLS